jgi:hypothetical protein
MIEKTVQLLNKTVKYKCKTGERQLETKRNRRRNLDRDLEAWIQGKARLGFQPAEIYRLILKEKQFLNRDNLPSEKTVQRVVNDVIIKDTSGPWTIRDVKVDIGNISLDDTRLILDILRVVFLITEGKKKSFTNKEAQWVLKIAKIRPQMDYLTIFMFAQFYIYYEAKGVSNEPLDIETMIGDGDNISDNIRGFVHDKGWICPSNVFFDAIYLNSDWKVKGTNPIDLNYEIITDLINYSDPNMPDSSLTKQEVGKIFNMSEDGVNVFFADEENEEVQDEGQS